MSSKELSVELRDKTVTRHRSGEGHQNISAALNASIILKWKKFGTTKTLPRAGRPAKLSNRERRALVREVTKNPMVMPKELQSSSVVMGEPSRRTTISEPRIGGSGLYGWVTRRKPLLSKRHLTARWEFAKGETKDFQTMKNKILWSDETKIKLAGMKAKGHIWKKTGTVTAVKHGF